MEWILDADPHLHPSLAAGPGGTAATIAYHKGLVESAGVYGADYVHFKELNALFDRASRKNFEIVDLG